MSSWCGCRRLPRCAAILSPPSLAPVVLDSGGPLSDLLRRHISQRLEPRILVTPAIDVDQILLARDDRAVTNLLVAIVPIFFCQPLRQLVDHPGRYPGPIGGVDISEQDQMRIQRAPVLSVAQDEASPIERVADGMDDVCDVGAIEPFTLHDQA